MHSARPTDAPAVRPAGPPAPVDHPAHRELVDALLHAGEPVRHCPSYALLWQRAAAEQHRAGRPPAVVERSLELLVTEILALSQATDWFGSRPRLAAAATQETVAYWTGTTAVASHAAHAVWQQCWESRTAATTGSRTDPVRFSDAVITEQRLRLRWAQCWQRWRLSAT